MYKKIPYTPHKAVHFTQIPPLVRRLIPDMM